MNCHTQFKAGVMLHSGAIGDCLLTLPLADSMKRTCALHRLDFIGPYDYITFYPQRTCIDAVLSMETLDLHRLFTDSHTFNLADDDPLVKAFSRYEHIVSFIGDEHPSFEKNLLFTVHSIRSAEVTLIPSKPKADGAVHVSDFYLNCFCRDMQLDPPFKYGYPQINPLPEDFSAGNDMLLEHDIDPDANVIVIQPGSGSLEKSWHWENFFQVACDVKSAGVQPVILLGPAEQERFEPEAIQAIRQFPVLENLSLTQVLQVLTQADAFLGNDSGIGHMAAGMGKKALIIFGRSSPVQYAPRGPHVHIEQLPPGRFSQFTSNTAARIVHNLLNML